MTMTPHIDPRTSQPQITAQHVSQADSCSPERPVAAWLDMLTSPQRMIAWGVANGWELIERRYVADAHVTTAHGSDTDQSTTAVIDRDVELGAIAERNAVSSTCSSHCVSERDAALLRLLRDNLLPVLDRELRDRASCAVGCLNCEGRLGYMASCACRISDATNAALALNDPACVVCLGSGQTWTSCPMCEGTGRTADRTFYRVQNTVGDSVIMIVDLPQMLRDGDIALTIDPSRSGSGLFELGIDPSSVVSYVQRQLTGGLPALVYSDGFANRLSSIFSASVTIGPIALTALATDDGCYGLDPVTVIDDLVRAFDIHTAPGAEVRMVDGRRVAHCNFEIEVVRSDEELIEELSTLAAFEGKRIGFTRGLLTGSTTGPMVVFVDADDSVTALALGQEWDITLAEASRAITPLFVEA